MALNSAAIPSALLKGEVFGHGRGAFTQTMAPFQSVDRGTLFLDEIGYLKHSGIKERSKQWL